MRTRSKSKKWSEEVAKHFEKELAKIMRMNGNLGSNLHRFSQLMSWS